MSERFEFRVFAPVRRYGALVQRFDGVLDAGEQDRREEVYLFGMGAATPQTSLKLRDGALCLKRLLRLSGDLELWRPEQDVFPLDRTTGVRIARTGAMPSVPGGGWTLAAHLLRDAEKAPDICLAHVRKLRRKFARGGLCGEAVRMEVNGAELASLALEDEDPERLMKLRAKLQLGGWENVCYPRMLQYLSGMAPLPPGAEARVSV
ncbi:MAG: hypothetical protein ACNA7W_08335 [Pseudomonadales bacterium]